MRRTLTGLTQFDTDWQLYAGDESEEYLADRSNGRLHSIQLVANGDAAVVPFLGFPRGNELRRDEDTVVPAPATAVTTRDYFA